MNPAAEMTDAQQVTQAEAAFTHVYANALNMGYRPAPVLMGLVRTLAFVVAAGIRGGKMGQVGRRLVHASLRQRIAFEMDRIAADPRTQALEAMPTSKRHM